MTCIHEKEPADVAPETLSEEERLAIQKELFLRRLEAEREAQIEKQIQEEQRERNRQESIEREKIIREQNSAYEESLVNDMMKEQQRLEAERKEQEEKDRQEAESELQSAKELSIKLSREAELKAKQEKWEATPKPAESATDGVCALVLRLPRYIARSPSFCMLTL